MFSLVQQSDVIFMEEMGLSYTHLMCFVCGVVEHLQLNSCVDDMLSASAESSIHILYVDL